MNQAPLTWKAKVKAATLWAGPDAVASHRSAAVLHALKFGDKAIIEVTAGKRMRSRNGIKVYFDPHIATRTKVIVDGIPCTTVARTILDLCGVLSENASHVVSVEAVRAKKTTVPALSRILDEDGGQGTDGTSLLRKIVKDRFAFGVTDSEAEDLFLTMAKKRGHGFTFHHVVQDPGFYAQLDFASLPEKVDIEIDGGKAHDDPAAGQRDRNRDAELESRGWVVLRFTYWDLIQRPDWVFERISMTLKMRRSTLAL